MYFHELVFGTFFARHMKRRPGALNEMQNNSTLRHAQPCMRGRAIRNAESMH